MVEFVSSVLGLIFYMILAFTFIYCMKTSREFTQPSIKFSDEDSSFLPSHRFVPHLIIKAVVPRVQKMAHPVPVYIVVSLPPGLYYQEIHFL